MIIDSLKNIKNYKNLDKIYDVLEFAAKTDFSEMPLGKYQIDGDNVFYMVQEYETKPNKNIGECHKKYIDIQLIVDGEEVIGYAPISCEKSVVEENPESDYILYNCETTFLTLKNDDFMVLYPNDIHNPGLFAQKPSKCRKVVFKIKI